MARARPPQPPLLVLLVALLLPTVAFGRVDVSFPGCQCGAFRGPRQLLPLPGARTPVSCSAAGSRLCREDCLQGFRHMAQSDWAVGLSPCSIKPSPTGDTHLSVRFRPCGAGWRRALRIDLASCCSEAGKLQESCLRI